MCMVSICVPIYGVEQYIERCAESLFEQTYNDIEYLFINDCTKDNSMVLLNKVILRYPNREKNIRIINHDRNLGLSGARITAIKESRGEFISWVDSDDYIEKDMIEKLVSLAYETKTDIISCNTLIHYPQKVYKLVSPKFETSQKAILAMLNRQAPVSVWARLIRRSLYIEHEIYPMIGINNGEDLQVMPRLAYYGKLSHLDDCLYHYNCFNSNSYTYKYTRNKADDVWSSLMILESFFYNREPILLRAVKQLMVKTIIKDIVNSCREGYVDYFIKARSRMNGVEQDIRKTLPFLYKVVWWLNSYNFVRYSTKFVDFFKHKNK